MTDFLGRQGGGLINGDECFLSKVSRAAIAQVSASPPALGAFLGSPSSTDSALFFRDIARKRSLFGISNHSARVDFSHGSMETFKRS